MRDIIRPQGAPAADAPRRPLGLRLAWFFGLAAGGVLTTAAAATVLHGLLFFR